MVFTLQLGVKLNSLGVCITYGAPILALVSTLLLELPLDGIDDIKCEILVLENA